MEEIPEDSKRDAIIDSLVDDIFAAMSRITVVNKLNLGHDNLLEVYQKDIKTRLAELIEHAVEKAFLHDK